MEVSLLFLISGLNINLKKQARLVTLFSNRYENLNIFSEYLYCYRYFEVQETEIPSL